MKNNPLLEPEKKQKEYYNKIANIYDVYHTNQCALQYRAYLYDKILEGINLTGFKVLDAMCGGGEATSYFLGRKTVVTGLDISEECCRIYKERFKSCRIRCSSINNTHLASSYFDIVVTDSLHHLHPHVEEGIKEIYRILKPGGYFLFWEPTAKSLVDIIRGLWYRIDNKYFEKNERSVDDKKLFEEFKGSFVRIKRYYGGNLAYLLINNALIFRIPLKGIKYYASPLFSVEKFVNNFQGRFFSCWVLGLWKKT